MLTSNPAKSLNQIFGRAGILKRFKSNERDSSFGSPGRSQKMSDADDFESDSAATGREANGPPSADGRTAPPVADGLLIARRLQPRARPRRRDEIPRRPGAGARQSRVPCPAFGGRTRGRGELTWAKSEPKIPKYCLHGTPRTASDTPSLGAKRQRWAESCPAALEHPTATSRHSLRSAGHR
jgi:hypothetical protein